MKRLCKLFSITFILLAITSCSQFISNSSNSEINVNFRTMDPLYEGAKLRIVVLENENAVAIKNETIRLSKTPISIKISNISVGSNVKLDVEIVKDFYGEPLVIYKTVTNEFVVHEGSNPVPLTLELVCPKVIVKPASDQIIEMSKVIGGNYIAIVNDEVQKLPITDVNTVLELEFYLKPNTNVPIRGYIEDKNQNIIYDFSEQIFKSSSSSNADVSIVQLHEIGTRYVLWSSRDKDIFTAGERPGPAYDTPYMSIYEKDVLDGTETASRLENNIEIFNFAIDRNQNIWTIGGDTSNQDNPELLLRKHTNNMNQGKKIPNKILPRIQASNIDLPSDIKLTSFYDKEKGSDVVIVMFINQKSVPVDSPPAYEYVIQYYYENEATSGEIVIPCSKNEPKKKLRAIHTDGKNLYISENYDASVEMIKTAARIINLGDVKTLMEIKSGDDSRVVFDTNDTEVILNETTNALLWDCAITDLLVLDNKLYALVACLKYPKGGLLTIDLSSGSVSANFFYTREGYDYVVDGYGIEQYIPDTDVERNLLSPRRIVAIKPEKFAIIDDGVCSDTSGGDGFKKKNRVVTVDIKNMVMNSVDLNNVTFDGYAFNGTCGWEYNSEIKF